MPITDTHSHYAAGLWKRCRDAVAGQRAVHNAGEAYLPKLSGQSVKEYEAYRSRAGYYNASGRTLDGMLGLMFRKTPTNDFPAAMQPIVDDATLSGVSAALFARGVAGDVLTVARAGLLVEYPSVADQPSNAAAAAAMNLRPYLSFYDAESMNWTPGRVNNVAQPVQIRLIEAYSVPKDEWSSEEHEQRRILDLRGETGKHVYRQRVYRQNADGGWFVFSEVIPLANGQPLDYIPFVFFGSEENSERVQVPPLSDLARP